MAILSRIEAARYLACSPRHFDVHIAPDLLSLLIFGGMLVAVACRLGGEP